MKSYLDHNGYKVRESVTNETIDIQMGSYRCLAFFKPVEGMWNVSFTGPGTFRATYNEVWAHHSDMGKDAATSLSWALTTELNQRIDAV